MANFCWNCLEYASSEEGIRSIIDTMYRNLAATRWTDGFEYTEYLSLEEAFDCVYAILNRKPAYLDAFRPGHGSRAMSDTASMGLIQCADDVWSLWITFSTAWGPVMEGDQVELDQSHCYLLSHRWREESSSSEIALTYLFSKDSWGEPYYELADEDKTYGSSMASAYCREFLNTVPWVDEFRFRYLVNSNKGEEIRALADKEELRRVAGAIDLLSLTRRGLLDSYAALLPMRDDWYQPRSIGELLKTFCEAEHEEALRACVQAYLWTDKTVDKAKSALREYEKECGNKQFVEQALSLIDEAHALIIRKEQEGPSDRIVNEPVKRSPVDEFVERSSPEELMRLCLKTISSLPLYLGVPDGSFEVGMPSDALVAGDMVEISEGPRVAGAWNAACIEVKSKGVLVGTTDCLLEKPQGDGFDGLKVSSEIVKPSLAVPLLLLAPFLSVSIESVTPKSHCRGSGYSNPPKLILKVELALVDSANLIEGLEQRIDSIAERHESKGGRSW